VRSCFTSYVGSQPQGGCPAKPRVGARNECLPWVRWSPLSQPQRGCPTSWTSARCNSVGQHIWGCGVCGGITQGRLASLANPGLCWETPLGFRCRHQTPSQILSTLWDSCGLILVPRYFEWKLGRLQPRMGRDVHNRRCSAAKPPVSRPPTTKPRRRRDYWVARCWWCVFRCNFVEGTGWVLQGKVARIAAKSSNKMAAI
jgi:hypothetical protein